MRDARAVFRCFGVIVIMAAICGGRANAENSFTMSLYQGVSLTTGMTCFDPTVLTVIVGTTPAMLDISAPPIEPLFEFPASVDLFFQLTTRAITPLEMVFSEQIQAAARIEAADRDLLESGNLRDLDWLSAPYQVAFAPGDLLAIRLHDDSVLLLDHVALHGATIMFDARRLDETPHPTPTPSAPASVPEPGTMILVGGGMMLMIAARKSFRTSRKNRFKIGMMFVLMSMCGWPLMASAAVVSFSAQGSRQGVILGPGIYCYNPCTSMRCDDACRQTVPEQTVLQLKADPDAFSVFRGWLVNGAPHEGVIEIHEDTAITALFESTLPPEQLAVRYYWYEGDAKKYAYLSLDEIEFDGKYEMWRSKTEEEQAQMVRTIEQAFHPHADYDGANLLKAPEPVTKEELLHTLDILQLLPYIENVRPVFYQTPVQHLGRVVLTNTITVAFSNTVTDQDIRAIEKQYGLIRVKTLDGVDVIYYDYRTGTPLECLETANRLYESGQVKYASPNWNGELREFLRRDDLHSKEEIPWHLYNEQFGQDLHIFENADGESVWDAFHVNF